MEKGLTFLQIGTLYAIREIAINILEIPSGFAADALGRRRTMVAAFLAYIVSFIVFYILAACYRTAFHADWVGALRNCRHDFGAADKHSIPNIGNFSGFSDNCFCKRPANSSRRQVWPSIHECETQ